MPPAKFTTSIIVTETKVTYQGKTKSGGTYSLYQVIATKPDGTAIDMALRSFADLPKHSVIQVECELYTSEQYGPSYTLSLKEGGQPQPQRQQQRQPQQQQSTNAMGNAVRDLLTRVKRIEDFLSGRGEFAGSAAQTSGPPPPAPPADPAPSNAGPPPDDSIPF